MPQTRSSKRKENNGSLRQSTNEELPMQLKNIIDLFETLIQDPKKQVSSNTIDDAATKVSETLSNVSYEDTICKYWEWHKKSAKCNTKNKQDNLLQNGIQLAKTTVKQISSASDIPPQLVKLLPPFKNGANEPMSKEKQDLLHLLEKLLPTGETVPYPKEKAQRLAKILYPYVESDIGKDTKFEFNLITSDGRFSHKETRDKGEAGLASLIQQLWECAQNGTRAVTLSLRVTRNTLLASICDDLDEQYKMSSNVCPRKMWCIGPPKKKAKVNLLDEIDPFVVMDRLPENDDPRWYLIIGAPGALTKSHWDRGVQAVLYHTLFGTNHALSIHREVAQMAQAVERGRSSKNSNHDWSNKFEYEVLKTCESTIQAGTFKEGETMLILPGGGHAILTGDTGKVILAGEYHLRTDTH